jgi:hypothetical protein
VSTPSPRKTWQCKTCGKRWVGALPDSWYRLKRGVATSWCAEWRPAGLFCSLTCLGRCVQVWSERQAPRRVVAERRPPPELVPAATTTACVAPSPLALAQALAQVVGKRRAA